MRNKLLVVLLSLIFLIPDLAEAQKQIDSPYSRFNIGSLQPSGSFSSLGMGGTGTALKDNSSLYFNNPATYCSLDTNSFVFDFGLDYGRNFINGSSSKFSSDDINFHHLVMGFPIKKNWGVSIGLVPVSSGFYNIINTVKSGDAGYNSSVGEYSIYHSGTGSLNKVFVGTGLQVIKNLSFGINFTYLSGKLTRSNEFIFSDLQNAFHNSSSESVEIRGLGLEFGALYSVTFKKDHFLNLGASLSVNRNYNTRYNELAYKYSVYSVSDTISYVADNNAKTLIPGTLRLGVAFGKKDKFVTSFDFIQTKWSSSKIPGTSGYAADTKNFALGCELTPDKYSNYSFLSRMDYRLGAHFGDNYLIINGEQIKEYGVSFGIGVPLRRTSSKANFFIDLTNKSGSATSSLHNEKYLTMGLSLNLYDFWFVKRKYD